MDSNTYSTSQPGRLGPLEAAKQTLATEDLDGLSAAVRAQRLLTWRRLLDRQEGLWLQELAAIDARGAAGADPDQAALSTARWLRIRLRLSAGAAHSAVRTARALVGGPCPRPRRRWWQGRCRWRTLGWSPTAPGAP